VVSRKIIALTVILIVLIVVAGLVVYYYNAYHSLTFKINSVSLGNVSLSSLSINLAFSIGNPNPLPIFVPNGNFEIYINNQHIGNGTFGSVTIGGNSQSTITVPVTFSASELPSVLYGLITGGGSVTVTIQGSANLGLFSIPFDTTLYNATF